MTARTPYRVALAPHSRESEDSIRLSLSQAMEQAAGDVPILERMAFRVLDSIRAGEARRIETGLSELPFVASASLDEDCARLTVDLLGGRAAGTNVLNFLVQRGLRVVPELPPEPEEDAQSSGGVGASLIVAVAGLVAGGIYTLGTSLSLQVRDVALNVQALLSAALVLWAGRGAFQRTLEAFMGGRLTSGALPLVAGTVVISSSLLTFFQGGTPHFEAGLVVFAGAVWLEAYERQAQRALGNVGREWRSCRSGFSAVLTGEGLFRIPRDSVQIGDAITAGTGEVLPVDATVLDGSAFVRQTMINPIAETQQVAVGDQVWAGMEIVTGSLAVRADKSSSASMIALAAKGLERVGRKEGWADRQVQRVLRFYYGGLLLVGTAWFTLPFTEAYRPDGVFESWVSMALVGLPFVFTQPFNSNIFRTVARLARSGTIVPDLESVARLSSVERLVFDVDGVLTCGLPEIEGWVTAPGVSPEAAWHDILALSERSSSPDHLAMNAFGRLQVSDPNAGTNVRESKLFGARGVRGVTEGGEELCLVQGSDVESCGAVLEEKPFGPVGFGGVTEPAIAGEASAQVVWYLLRGTSVMARVHVFDPIRGEAREVRSALESHGLEGAVSGLGGTRRAVVLAGSVGLKLIDAGSVGSQQGRPPVGVSASVCNPLHQDKRRSDGLVLSYGAGMASVSRGGASSDRVTVLTESMHGIPAAMGELKTFSRRSRASLVLGLACAVPSIAVALSGLLPWLVAASLGVALNVAFVRLNADAAEK